MTRMQRWLRLSEQERDLVRGLARESGRPLWQVFEELYPEDNHGEA